MQQKRVPRHQARHPNRPTLCVPQMAAGIQVRACILLKTAQTVQSSLLASFGGHGVQHSAQAGSQTSCQPHLQPRHVLGLAAKFAVLRSRCCPFLLLGIAMSLAAQPGKAGLPATAEPAAAWCRRVSGAHVRRDPAMPPGDADERPRYQSDERWEVRCLAPPAAWDTK